MCTPATSHAGMGAITAYCRLAAGCVSSPKYHLYRRQESWIAWSVGAARFERPKADRICC